MTRPTFTAFLERTLRIRMLSRAQLAFCRVVFDGLDPAQLDPADRDVATAMFGDVDTIPPDARRVLAAFKGARTSFPGSWGCSLFLLFSGLTVDLRGLALGEHGFAVIVAPDLRLARQDLRYITGAVDSSPELSPMVVSRGTDSLTLRRPDGYTIMFECLPASRGGSATRGRTLFGALLDEASFFRDPDTGVVNDAETYRSLLPRLTIPGAMMQVISTAWLESGLLFDLHQRNFGEPLTAVAATCPTLTMRDDDSIRAVVAAEDERDPDNADREFRCVTLPGGSGEFFGPALLRPCVDPEMVSVTSPDRGCRSSIGADLAQVRDATAFSSVHHFRDGHMLSAECLEIRPERGKVLQLSQLVPTGCEFARRHRQHIIHADHHLAPAAREHLPDGYHWRTVPGGQAQKAVRFLAVREMLRERKLTIPGDQRRLIRQLSEVVAKPLPGGTLQIIQPRRAGVHGDTAAAFVIAAWSSRKGGRSLLRVLGEMTPRERSKLIRRSNPNRIDLGNVETGAPTMSNAEWSRSPHRAKR